MFKSIKSTFRIFVVAIILITAFILQIVLSYCTLGKVSLAFKTPVVITVGVLIIIALLFSEYVLSSIILPLKKLEKSMRLFTEGKHIDAKALYNYARKKELIDVVSNYEVLVNAMVKNNFALNSEESKTEIILEKMDDGVVAFSIHHKVIHMNTAAKKHAFLDEADNTYEKVMKKLGIKLDFDKVLYEQSSKNIEQKVKLKDDVLNVVLVPFFSNKLTPMGVIMVIKNITEIEKLNNMRKEFVANVSHELKTPLSSIKGYSETMIDRDLTKEEIAKFATVINDEANRMDRIVADLLQLSRYDYNKNVVNRVKFNLDDLAKQVVENMQYIAKEKKHKLSCIVTKVPPPIFADKDGMQQVITNIVSNSIKYTPDGGNITVYIGAIGNKAYMKFVDNGIGIPEKDLGRIFERFYRVDKARSRSMGGTGLGLSIVKEIITSHDGTIDVKSTVGSGTEITVTLPTLK